MKKMINKQLSEEVVTFHSATHTLEGHRNIFIVKHFEHEARPNSRVSKVLIYQNDLKAY